MQENTDPGIPNQIEGFIHCAMCADELPNDLSHREYASLEVGWTDDGRFQVWCQRHEINVVLMGPDDDGNDDDVIPETPTRS